MTRAGAACLAVVAVLVAGATTWPACGPSRITEAPVLPSLDGMDPPVVEKIKSVHAQVLADPSPANWARYARTLHAHDIAREALAPYLLAAEHTEMPGKFELLYLAGHSAFKWNPERAIELLEQADKLRDDYQPLHLRLGLLYETAQRWDDARGHFERAQELNRKEQKPASDALAGLGRVQLAQGRVAEAIPLLERARAIDSEHREVHAALGAAYARVGRKDDAARESAAAGDLEEAHAFVDPIATSMHREGVSYASLQRFGIAALRGGSAEQALPAFERALALRPDQPDAMLAKAQALAQLGRCEEAEPLLDRVLARLPDSLQCLRVKAACEMSRGDLQGAIAHLTRTLAADPTHLGDRFNLGRALRGVNRPAEAREHLRYVVERKPNRAAARLELASAFADEDKVAEAAAEIAIVLVQDPGNRQALALREKLGK